MVNQIFINLPVKDLSKSNAFFSALGFAFDTKFSNEIATCIILGENIFAMILKEDFFKTFTPKAICDTTKNTETLICIQVESREKVDELLSKAVISGGKEPREKQDHGWMYARSMEDIDGHIWEVMFADPSAMIQQV